MWAQTSFIWSQITCLTDRQTDRQTDRPTDRKALAITCSALHAVARYKPMQRTACVKHDPSTLCIQSLFS